MGGRERKKETEVEGWGSGGGGGRGGGLVNRHGDSQTQVQEGERRDKLADDCFTGSPRQNHKYTARVYF